MVKLKKYPVSYLQEIFQTIDTKFAFVNDKYEQVHVPGKCRDFLGDCLWSRQTKNPVSIYGFEYDFSKNSFDVTKTRLSLTFPSTEIKEIFLSRIKDFPMLKAKVLETDCPFTLIVEAPKMWQSAVWKISLFTFYLKLCCYKTNSDAKSPENNYLELFTQEKESKLLAKVKGRKVFWSDDLHINHNYKGFYSILKKFIASKQEHAYIFGMGG